MMFLSMTIVRQKKPQNSLYINLNKGHQVRRMKLIKDKEKAITVDILPYHINLTIRLKRDQIHSVQNLMESLQGINTDKDYEIIIQPKRKKRSLDANAYFWVLVSKLGEKLRKSDTEIYRNIVRDNGVFQVVPIREDILDRWADEWGSKGTGCITEDIGECKNYKGYHNVKCYFGSSKYTTEEMARLIDAVIIECKEQGIETMTPDKIEELKQKWGCG